jgi:YegS/Rv2252/BmrU family lipid kinase
MLIVNPSAGQGVLGKSWESEVFPFLSQQLRNFEFEFTKKPGDATKLAAQAFKQGYTLVVSMGGDGTLNECVNGYFENGAPINPHAALGLLPFGSGGDFARSIQMPRDYKLAVKHLLTRKIKQIDVGLAHFPGKRMAPRYFINIANAGAVAMIMKRVNSMNRRIPPLARYLAGTALGFVDSKNIKVRIRLTPQGTHVVNLTNLVVANGQYFGKGMRPAPQAKIDDGLFDVVVLKNASLSQLVINLPQLYGMKTTIPNKIVETYRASEVSVSLINPANKLYTEMDGENYGEGEVVFSIVPGVVNFKI